MSNIQRHHEHGKDWLTCLECGASWSIEIWTVKGVPQEEAEQIDYGDESCDEADHIREIEMHHLREVDEEYQED